jgi:predicted ABC-type transport system involved in lysophospholipase L1 biosynthesis ATPase subunit
MLTWASGDALVRALLARMDILISDNGTAQMDDGTSETGCLNECLS